MNFTDIDPSFQLPNEVWERVKKAIPPAPPKPKGGRPRLSDRRALDAIFERLRTGLPVESLTPLFGSLQYRS